LALGGLRGGLKESIWIVVFLMSPVGSQKLTDIPNKFIALRRLNNETNPGQRSLSSCATTLKSWIPPREIFQRNFVFPSFGAGIKMRGRPKFLRRIGGDRGSQNVSSM